MNKTEMKNFEKLKLDDEKFHLLNGVVSDDCNLVLSFLPSGLSVEENKTCELFIVLTDENLLNVKNNFNVRLKENSKLNVYVLLESDDLKSEINFNVLHVGCRSRCEFVMKTLLDGDSDLKFSGVIGVEKNVSSVVSSLRHDTLLLSSKSKVITMPALEIFNDDVEVEHSASVGHFDDDKLFYLQSRGLSYNESKMLLMDAFMLSDLRMFSDEFYEKITKI